jgi:pSer/pThr/pTyr-binding forkhead associated (FHA) protein
VEAALNGPFGRTMLSPARITIGRSPDNQMVLNDSQASSHHAEIHADSTGYVISDLGSTNGTFVNQQRLTPNVPYVLRPADIIRIGGTEFTYEINSNQQDDATIVANPGRWDESNYPPTVAGTPDSNPYSYNPDGPAYPPPPGYSQQNYQQPTSYPQQGYPAPAPNYPNYDSPQQPYVPPVQAGQYGQPGQSDITAPGRPVQPARKSRLGLWIALIIVALLIIAGGIGAFIYSNRSTPTKTLQAYCDAIKTNNAQEAYNQLSSRVQSQTTQQQFTTNFNTAERLLNSSLVGGISDCTASNVQENGSSATGTVVITVKNGSKPISSTESLVNENGTWKINSATRSTAP